MGDDPLGLDLDRRRGAEPGVEVVLIGRRIRANDLIDPVELNGRDVLNAIEGGPAVAVGDVVLVGEVPVDDRELILAVGRLDVLERLTGARAGGSPRSTEHLSEHHPLHRSGRRRRQENDSETDPQDHRPLGHDVLLRRRCRRLSSEHAAASLGRRSSCSRRSRPLGLGGASGFRW
jgi:hypothetical protein